MAKKRSEMSSEDAEKKRAQDRARQQKRRATVKQDTTLVAQAEPVAGEPNAVGPDFIDIAPRPDPSKALPAKTVQKLANDPSVLSNPKLVDQILSSLSWEQKRQLPDVVALAGVESPKTLRLSPASEVVRMVKNRRSQGRLPDIRINRRGGDRFTASDPSPANQARRAMYLLGYVPGVGEDTLDAPKGTSEDPFKSKELTSAQRGVDIMESVNKQIPTQLMDTVRDRSGDDRLTSSEREEITFLMSRRYDVPAIEASQKEYEEKGTIPKVFPGGSGPNTAKQMGGSPFVSRRAPFHLVGWQPTGEGVQNTTAPLLFLSPHPQGSVGHAAALADWQTRVQNFQKLPSGETFSPGFSWIDKDPKEKRPLKEGETPRGRFNESITTGAPATPSVTSSSPAFDIDEVRRQVFSDVLRGRQALDAKKAAADEAYNRRQKSARRRTEAGERAAALRRITGYGG